MVRSDLCYQRSQVFECLGATHMGVLGFRLFLSTNVVVSVEYFHDYLSVVPKWLQPPLCNMRVSMVMHPL